MSETPGDEERDWAADKRDFVADSRDEAAQLRDAVADAREEAADNREAELDAWEQQLAERSAALGLPVEDTPATADRTAARANRARGREERAGFRVRRGEASLNRDEASARRLGDGRPTRLALAFAGIAEQLYGADTVEDVLQRIAEAAVDTVAGCRVASVTLLEEGGYRTAASTDATATAVDSAQYRVGEGPSLEACVVPVVYAASFPDDRWPVLGARPLEFGVNSALSYRLAGAAPDAESGSGALNTYSATEEGFDDAAQEIGYILAAHASVAARAVGERSSLEGTGRQLQDALLTRDIIGQAKGILMERLRITPDDAFDVLRNSSQRLNVKLHEVARRLTETGELNHGDL
ncbi:MAG TPA: ANTAR domain-containing protein [Propionicimonas sp.]|jgi:hypothetical protein|uniref:ANTAR domain-containing protein n=1 Tax=Propionicimonas sp. TaxID=1955623 RepID=UPI002F42C5C8